MADAATSDSNEEGVDQGRRQLLVASTTALGAVGAALALTPFLASWKPSARAKALGAPVDIDVSKLEPGAMIKVEWRGQPIWVVRRTPEMIQRLESVTALLADPDSAGSDQPEFARNTARASKPEYLVIKGVCTHLGCAPINRFEVGVPDLSAQLGAEWPGGFYCPCHGSMFDLSGRVYKNVPAPKNLAVPPYAFVDANLIRVGVESTGAA